MFDEGQTNTVQEPTDVTPATSESEDWLVVGERKYDKEAAVTKITHADNHISKLEQELLDLRKKLELTTAQEEARKAMSQLQSQPSTQPSVQNTTETAKDDDTALLSKVEQLLLKRDQEAAKQTNLSSATEAARSVYGDSYQQKLEETGKSLGLSKADIVELASTKPQAFKQLFGLANTAPAPKPSATSTVTFTGTPNGDDPYRSAAKLVLGSSSAKERTSAIAALLAKAN